MKKLLVSIGQMLFPNLCVCCDGYLSFQEDKVCDLCLYTLPKFEQLAYKDNAVAKKFWGRLNAEAATAVLNFNGSGDVRKILHQIKYKGNMDLGKEMGVLMGSKIVIMELHATVDFIIPVPLHAKRQNFRGYNQCDLLADGISEVTQLRVRKDVLVRQKHNGTQTKKKRYERFINAKEIFRVAKPEELKNKHVLLLDDVITTGATLEACGSALLEVEGLKLSIICLAAAT